MVEKDKFNCWINIFQVSDSSWVVEDSEMQWGFLLFFSQNFSHRSDMTSQKTDITYTMHSTFAPKISLLWTMPSTNYFLSLAVCGRIIIHPPTKKFYPLLPSFLPFLQTCYYLLNRSNTKSHNNCLLTLVPQHNELLSFSFSILITIPCSQLVW